MRAGVGFACRFMVMGDRMGRMREECDRGADLVHVVALSFRLAAEHKGIRNVAHGGTGSGQLAGSCFSDGDRMLLECS